MKYKAVIFDLFGTLVKNFPRDESDNNLRRMASELAVPADDFMSLWHAAFNDRMKGVLKNYQACIRRICRQLGADLPDEKIELAAGTRFEMNRRELMAPRDGAIEVMSSLKTKGHKIGLVSNCSNETVIVWESSPLAPLVDAAIFSSLAGLRKPDPRIYQIATEKLAVRPEQCLYIADGMDQELASAAIFGMNAVLIRVDGEDDYDSYREKWGGPVISSLREVLSLVG
jgi:putative hydrolase of the HAD superfamily